MQPSFQSLMPLLPAIAIGFSAVSLFFAVFAFRYAYRKYVLDWTNTLHSKLYGGVEDYQVVYCLHDRTLNYYFDTTCRGAEGNFLGSEDEPRVDLFLDRLNFVCKSLIDWAPRNAEALFKADIENLYKNPFFQEYFSFLRPDYYSFIHEYAQKRLKLPRPHVPYPDRNSWKGPVKRLTH